MSSADTKAARFKEAASEHDQRVGDWATSMANQFTYLEWCIRGQKRPGVPSDVNQAYIDKALALMRPATAPADLATSAPVAVQVPGYARSWAQCVDRGNDGWSLHSTSLPAIARGGDAK